MPPARPCRVAKPWEAGVSDHNFGLGRQRRHRRARLGHRVLPATAGAPVSRLRPDLRPTLALRSWPARRATPTSKARRLTVQRRKLRPGRLWRLALGRPVFVNAAVGVARDNIDDIERTTSLAPIVHTAETRALSTGARLQGGMWFDMGGDRPVAPRGPDPRVQRRGRLLRTGRRRPVSVRRSRPMKALTGEVALRAEAEMGGFGLFAEGRLPRRPGRQLRSGARRSLQQPGPGAVARDRRSVRRPVPGLGRRRGFARPGQGDGRPIAAASATTPTATWAAFS